MYFFSSFFFHFLGNIRVSAVIVIFRLLTANLSRQKSVSFYDIYAQWFTRIRWNYASADPGGGNVTLRASFRVESVDASRGFDIAWRELCFFFFFFG